MDIRFLGHACFELSDGSARVLFDPDSVRISRANSMMEISLGLPRFTWSWNSVASSR